MHVYTPQVPCDCYSCVGEKYGYHNGHRFIKNNLKHHTFLEPCRECGRPKTEHVDLGTKGYFECWWCHHRTADGDRDH